MPMPSEYPDRICSYDGDHCACEFAISLKEHLRLLWEQHIYWTRIVILGIAFDSPDLEASTTRLLRNAPDLAKVFRHFYGNVTANEVEELIRAHLTIAAELVTAAKAGNSKAAADAEKRWYHNANEIACFLAEINPCWSYECLRSMWFEHLSLTKEEVVAILNQKYTQSVELFDCIEKQILEMSDTLFDGIICQLNM